MNDRRLVGALAVMRTHLDRLVAYRQQQGRRRYEERELDPSNSRARRRMMVENVADMQWLWRRATR